MAGETLTVRRVCRLWLRQHGFDGLCSKRCGCELDDLMPCVAGGGIVGCRPGYRTPALDRPGYVFIGLDRARSPRAAPYAAHPDPDGGSSRYGRSVGPAIPLSAALGRARHDRKGGGS